MCQHPKGEAQRAMARAFLFGFPPPVSPPPEVPPMLDGGLHEPERMTTMEVARHEYVEMGTLSTDTYMALNNEGLNADLVLAQLAGELDNG